MLLDHGKHYKQTCLAPCLPLLNAVLYFSEMKWMVLKEKRHIIDNIIEEERKHFIKLSKMKKLKEKK